MDPRAGVGTSHMPQSPLSWWESDTDAPHRQGGGDSRAHIVPAPASGPN